MPLEHEKQLLKKTLDVIANALHQGQPKAVRAELPAQAPPPPTAGPDLQTEAEQPDPDDISNANASDSAAVVDAETVQVARLGSIADDKFDDAQDPVVSELPMVEAKPEEADQALVFTDDAADWLQSVPWEDEGSPVAARQSAPAPLETSPEADIVELGADEAESFFADLPWAGEAKSEGSAADANHAPLQADELESLGDEADVTSFMEGVNWSGDEGQITVDPASEDGPPAHVEKILEGRKLAPSLSPLDDAISRSHGAKDARGDDANE